MKRIIYILALILTVSIGAHGQTLIERSDGTFTQGDTYLAALKTLSIPFGESPSFDGGLAREGSLFFNTSTSKLVVWTGSDWEDVGKETDLSDYYTKSQVDALLAAYSTTEDMNSAIAAAVANKVDDSRTVNGKPLTSDVVIGIADIPGLQAALDGKQGEITGAASTIVDDNLTQNRAVISDGSGKVAVSPVTATELGYVSGVTSGVQSQLDSKIPLTQKGANNGVAPLGSDGKVPAQYIDVTGMTYMGTWDASTNTPTLSDATGAAGQYYRVTTGGTQNLGSGSISFIPGDDVIHNGTIWQRIPSTQLVTDVNGQTGSVELGKADVGLGNVDNTSDMAKPISTATQNALDAKENAANKVNNMSSPNSTTFPTTGAVQSYVQSQLPAAQTLSLGAEAGEITISGGNSIQLPSLSRGQFILGSFEDAFTSLPIGFNFIANTTGSTGFPAATGQGFISKRASFNNSQGAFAIWKSNSSNDRILQFNVGLTGADWNGWETFASREWAVINTLGNLSSHRLDLVTGNTDLNSLTIPNGVWGVNVGAIANTPATSSGTIYNFRTGATENGTNFNSQIYHAISNSVGVPSRLFARHYNSRAQAWADWSQLAFTSDIPTNFVTTNTNQSGISGNKGWVGRQTWTPPIANSPQPASSMGIFTAANQASPVLWGTNASGTSSFNLRTYAIGGYQLTLSEGGILAHGTLSGGANRGIDGTTILTDRYDNNGSMLNVGVIRASGTPFIGRGMTVPENTTGTFISTHNANLSRSGLSIGTQLIFYSAPTQTTSPGSAINNLNEYTVWHSGNLSAVTTNTNQTNIEGTKQWVGTNTFTQPVTVATPTAANHATTKQYVDDAIANGAAKSESITVAAAPSYTLSWNATYKQKFGPFGTFEVWLNTGSGYKKQEVPISMSASGGEASSYTFTLSNIEAIIVVR